MNTDEKRVADFLREYGLICRPFSEGEMRKGKTPDYRVLLDDEMVFYCEVKTSETDDWVGGSRNDPIFSRLEKKIDIAVEQFDAVNPDLSIPNVLVLVNHDMMCGFLDLLAVITGYFFADNGHLYPIYQKFSEGRIKGKKGRIHLYVWLDNREPTRNFFSNTNPEFHLRLCKWFGVDPASIRPVGSNG